MDFIGIEVVCMYVHCQLRDCVEIVALDVPVSSDDRGMHRNGTSEQRS